MRELPVQTNAIVSVAEMARMVGLSRSRFYELMQVGTFPPPLYDIHTRRPLYTEEQQVVCLDVRRRNCGINGRPVLFYARGFHPINQSAVTRPTKTATQKNGSHTDLIDGLAALGLAHVTSAEVTAAIKAVYPSGAAETDRGEVLRSVFLHLKRRDSGDKVGR